MNKLSRKSIDAIETVLTVNDDTVRTLQERGIEPGEIRSLCNMARASSAETGEQASQEPSGIDRHKLMERLVQRLVHRVMAQVPELFDEAFDAGHASGYITAASEARERLKP